MYLYGLGLRPLGHIQTGNIYLAGEVCRLGGYESRLLGYKTRLYKLCKDSDCSEYIDVIMIGKESGVGCVPFSAHPLQVVSSLRWLVAMS